MADWTQQAIDAASFAAATQVDDSHAQTIAIPFGAGGGAAPVIDNFSPSVGTPLARSDSVAFDVTDDTGLLRAEVFVTLGGDTFVVHDGDIFRGAFANLSTRSPIAGGFRYNVKRNGGWIESPTFEVHATDTSGQEAS